ncbi:MAG: hypothetical protein MUE83_16615, partial [Tabrizicola sp.]|nr:hypothetical protein [Tabrizicola sp.]
MAREAAGPFMQTVQKLLAELWHLQLILSKSRALGNNFAALGAGQAALSGKRHRFRRRRPHQTLTDSRAKA